MKISNDVLAVLEKAEVDGRRLMLGPPGSLDRKLYVETNKALEAMGGKWAKSAKAHVFDSDAGPIIAQLLDSGECSRVKQDLGQFESPPAVVSRIMELSEIGEFPGAPAVLEPSAGSGNIALAALAAGARVTAYEIDPKRVAALRKAGVPAVNEGDFLTSHLPAMFDLVLMNPPFAKQADIDHVLHAAKFLKAGGRLVSVMSASVMFRDNKKTQAFRDWVHEQPTGTMEMLPDDAFKASGTAVRACIVAVDI